MQRSQPFYYTIDLHIISIYTAGNIEGEIYLAEFLKTAKVKTEHFSLYSIAYLYCVFLGMLLTLLPHILREMSWLYMK